VASARETYDACDQPEKPQMAMEMADVSDFIGVADRRGDRKVKKRDRRLQEDSNAALCPDYFARTRKLLINEDGSATALPRVTRFIGFAAFVASWWNLYWKVTDWSKPTASDLLYVINFMCTDVLIFCLALIVNELRYVIRPLEDGGELACLGAGTAMIRESAAKGLERQRIFFRGACCCCSRGRCTSTCGATAASCSRARWASSSLSSRRWSASLR